MRFKTKIVVDAKKVAGKFKVKHYAFFSQVDTNSQDLNKMVELPQCYNATKI